ncbi:MAG: tetratricopeptide repeat protein, partial [Calditrichaceae bacterium]
MNKLLIYIFIFSGIQTIFAQGIRSKVNEGNQNFKAEKYEEALSKYQDALLDEPVNEKIIFNKGDALYKLKKYDEAIEEFQKVVGSEDLNLSAKALHNIGNAYFKQDKLKECIDAYERSLELNPDDYDTKFNLELARAKLKEQAKKQPQNQQQQQ